MLMGPASEGCHRPAFLFCKPQGPGKALLPLQSIHSVHSTLGAPESALSPDQGARTADGQGEGNKSSESNIVPWACSSSQRFLQGPILKSSLESGAAAAGPAF